MLSRVNKNEVLTHWSQNAAGGNRLTMFFEGLSGRDKICVADFFQNENVL